MLKMTNIAKVYRTDMVETHALRSFDLEVKTGEFVTITGPSGSGKTTFLNIAGLLEPFSSGSYQLNGVEMGALSDNQLAKARNESIGFIFQGFNLIPDLTVAENIEVPLRYRGVSRAERKSRVEEALEMVGLSARYSHLPAQLSGGQQQRVAIARAMAGKPAFLLADEPTGNLDTLMARQVMDMLESINAAGTTIVMVTHDPDLARRAQRNIQIVDGQVSDYRRFTEAPATAEA
ncbi:ABC transporter ATP-binding protein [uncultured Umboniibacter sp.]|uniref:ABC transporter ATP-binding protein n=1 Tax=uncultured Umboniibacter sp. TaxID=1798917 RepID=UPI00260A4039|nr:ABC transporter ATP-binding protein [uncultured Umboniibacter sp.]